VGTLKDLSLSFSPLQHESTSPLLSPPSIKVLDFVQFSRSTLQTRELQPCHARVARGIQTPHMQLSLPSILNSPQSASVNHQGFNLLENSSGKPIHIRSSLVLAAEKMHTKFTHRCLIKCSTCKVQFKSCGSQAYVVSPPQKVKKMVSMPKNLHSFIFLLLPNRLSKSPEVEGPRLLKMLLSAASSEGGRALSLSSLALPSSRASVIPFTLFQRQRC